MEINLENNKYYDYRHDRAIDPQKDGCKFEDWPEQYPQALFSSHPNGYLIFLPPDQLQSSDEYNENDPYSVAENLGSDFQQRRVQSTLELIGSTQALAEGSKILDLGCGKGYITAEIKKHYPKVEVSGLDYSLSAIDFAAQNFKEIDFCVANAFNPPYARNYFDLVVCNNLWEHVPDPLNLLEKIRKITKPGGFLIVSTPSRYRIGNLARVLIGKPVIFMSKYHVTEYSVGQIIEQLHYGKFEVVRVYSKPAKEKYTGLKQEILSLLMEPALSLLIKLNHSHHSLEGTVFYLARNA
jgi:ubiquinone/menaquinone biosynthesis C-methylase UbiE